ncbi:MAG: hypothetical protein IT379_34540 [Deltaproteobacteria bacterium]|nr:hypothetical protein [Deltaproteobacteria bacterium]
MTRLPVGAGMAVGSVCSVRHRVAQAPSARVAVALLAAAGWIAGAACDDADLVRVDSGSPPPLLDAGLDAQERDGSPGTDAGPSPADAGLDAMDVGPAPMDTGPEPGDARSDAMDARLDATDRSDGGLDATALVDAEPDVRDAIPPDAADAGDSGASYRIEGAPTEGPFRGSTTGGSPFASACGAQRVLSGLDVQVDVMNLNPVTLRAACTQVAADGTLIGETAGATISGGCAPIPTDDFADRCPAGSVVIGLHGEASSTCCGELVGYVGVVCADFVAWVAGEPVIAERLPSRGSYPGTSPVPFDDRCPPGSVVTGLSGRVGCALDGLRIVCTPVVR